MMRHRPLSLAALLLTALWCGLAPAFAQEPLATVARCGLGTAPTRPRLAAQAQSQSALPDSLLTAHFRIRFTTTPGRDAVDPTDLGGNGIPDYVDSTAAILERVYRREVVELGEPAPLTDDGRIEVQLLDIAREGVEYGSTQSDDWTYTGFDGPASVTLLLDRNYGSASLPTGSRGLNGLRVSAAHEFHHAVQAVTGIHWDETYLNEMVSVWWEMVVFPEVPDFLQYLNTIFSAAPTPLYRTAGYEYGLWLHGVERRYGLAATVRTVRRTLERQAAGVPALAAMDEALRTTVATTLGWEFGQFWLWNQFTGTRTQPHHWPDAARLPTQQAQSLPAEGVTGRVEPLGARIYRRPDGRHEVVYRVDLPNGTVPAPLDFSLRLDATGTPQLRAIEPAPSATLRALLGWETDTEQPTTRFAAGAAVTAQPFPQPFRPGRDGAVRLPVELATASEIELTVFRPSGQTLIRRLVTPTQPPGAVGNEVSWDGRDAGGSAVGSGLYLYRLRSADGAFERLGKIVVVR